MRLWVSTVQLMSWMLRDCRVALRASWTERSITNVITQGNATMHQLKLIQIGNSVGIILPKDLLTRLKLEKGDTVFITDTPEGYAITPHDPAFETQMEAAREIMKSRRAVLRELAK